MSVARCQHCEGEGLLESRRCPDCTEICPRCNGSGWVEVTT